MTLLPVRAKPRAGVTLLELLIVMAVISLLMGLLLPAIFRVNTGIRRRRADAAVKAIQTGIKAYHHRYQKWPAPVAQLEAGADITYGEAARPNHHVVRRLLHPPDGVDAPEADAPLLDLKHFRVSGNGNVLDPWWSQADDENDAQYRIRMDMDYDGTPPGGVRVWSVNR